MSANIQKTFSKHQIAGFQPSVSVPVPTLPDTLSPHYSPQKSVNLPVSGMALGANLDTLAQLRKRSRNKFISNGVVFRLVDVKFSPLRKSYWNTFHCARDLDQEGHKIKGKYCNNRWCNQCNRIRTANLMNGYTPLIKKMYDPYFVTLTIPNVLGVQLSDAMELMHKRFKQLRDRLRKAGMSVIGLRKLECTYNAKRNDYHPHYHLVISGADVAKQIVSDWLAYYPGADIRGQDIRPADENSTKELFKYFTKMVSKNEAGETGFHVESLDVIFQAMRGKRVFQPMGIKKISEEVEKEQTNIHLELPYNYKSWQFDDKRGDYVDRSGQPMTGYIPTETARRLRGVGDVQDWQALDQEFRAIKNFDNREYWKERTAYWENITTILETIAPIKTPAQKFKERRERIQGIKKIIFLY